MRAVLYAVRFQAPTGSTYSRKFLPGHWCVRAPSRPSSAPAVRRYAPSQELQERGRSCGTPLLSFPEFQRLNCCLGAEQPTTATQLLESAGMQKLGLQGFLRMYELPFSVSRPAGLFHILTTSLQPAVCSPNVLSANMSVLGPVV